MARAQIPYFEIDQFIEQRYPTPVFQNARRDRFPREIPRTVYDRSTGNFARIGYLVWMSYERLTGFNENLDPVYDRVYERNFVPISMDQSTL